MWPASQAPGSARCPSGPIAPNPHQPRAHFDEEALASLTASVAELGVLQPVLVREVGDERYELIAGERRWRAAKRAGLPLDPGGGAHRRRGAVARAGAGREPAPGGPQPARGGRRLPAADRGLRAHAGGGGPEGRPEPAPRWPTRSGSSSCRRASSGCWPRTSWRPATPRPCSGPRIAPSRSALAKQIVADGLSVREVEEAVRQHNEPEDAAPERCGCARDRQSRRGPSPAAAGAARARGAAGRPTSTPG